MSGQLRLLPSELARLVLGYLIQHECHDAAENFLKELPELGECLALRKHGRPVCTTVGDRSLEDMLNDYADAREQVQNSIQQHPGVLRNMSKSWDLKQQLMEITKIATEKRSIQESGMLGRKSANMQRIRTTLLNKQQRNTLISTQQCCEHCALKIHQTKNPLLDVSTTSIKDLPGSANHSSANPAEDDQMLVRDSTESDSQDSTITQKISGSEEEAIGKIIQNNSINVEPISNASNVQLMRMRSGLQPDVISQPNIEGSSPCQELSNSNISSSSMDATPQKRKGNQVKRRSQGQIGSNIAPTVDEDVHFEIMLKKLMEDTSLHEKIAENINRGLSNSQSRCQQQTSSQDGSCSLETLKTDGSKIEKSGEDSTFPCELESIITNIVSETTESPNFETILEEVFGSSLQKSAHMNSEGIQNELTGIPARPLSTPIPQSQSADNITNYRTSTACKENNQNENSSITKESSLLYKIIQKDKLWDAKLRESSQIKNDQFRNEMLAETSNAQMDHEHEVIKELSMKKTKIANTDDISSTNVTSTSENSTFLRSEMNVPHKLRHKLNRNSSIIQLNSNSSVTSQTDNLHIISSQPFEKTENRDHEHFQNNVSENKSANNNLDKDTEHVNDTDVIEDIEIQSKEIGTFEKSIKKQNCVNQMSQKIDIAEIKNTYQVNNVDNESDSSRESLHIECSLPSLDKTYRISDISNIPNTSNKNISKIASEIIEQGKTTSESLLQITSPTPQKSIFTASDSKNVNENTNQEKHSTNEIEISTNSSADLISISTTPIKSMTVPGIATALPVKQMESPYKILETNDSTLTELKSMRSDISSSAISGHWSSSLNMKENISESTNLNLPDISMASTNISNGSEKTLNINSSTSTNHIANSFSLELTPICISQPAKEMVHGLQPINSISNTSGVSTLAQMQIIPLQMNMGATNSRQRYSRTTLRTIAPKPIAPKLDTNLSYSPKKNYYETTNQAIIKDDHTLDTPLIILPNDTVVYPAIKDINPAPITTYKLANNVTFTIPSIPSIMPIANQNAKVESVEENKRNSPSKKKSPKSPIRGRVVNMTRVKNKNGVGKAGKRKLRAQKELENISKSNDLVSAAVTLSLSATPTKNQSPSKELEIPSDGIINDSSNNILQTDATTCLGEKEHERNYEENNVLLGSVSPKLKELLNMSKNIGSGKKKTKCHSVHKSPVSKMIKEFPSRGSQSTPSHKNSHVRALDFGTPGKDISPRKLRKQQVMQSLNFSPSLRFKKTLKSTNLDDRPSKPFNKFSPKKRILERIQEETNTTLEKDDFKSKSMKKHAISKKKPGSRKNKSPVSKPNVNTIVSKKDPPANFDNINNKNGNNSKTNSIHNDKKEKDCMQIVNNPLSYESIRNSGNEKVCDSSNKKIILETPIKTNDILTLEFATPFLGSVKNTCDNEDDLNTPFPRFSGDYEQTRSPRTDKNPISTSSVLSTHYQPGIKEQKGIDFSKTVTQSANIKNQKKEHKKDKHVKKKNVKAKKNINQKKISGIKMGKKIEEEIASRFGSPNSTKLQMEISMNNSNLCKQSSIQCHDMNQDIEKGIEKFSSKCNDPKYVPIKEKVTILKEGIIIEKYKIALQNDKKTPKRITRSAMKLDNSLCIPEKKLSMNISSSQNVTDYNENMDKSKENNENNEKESYKLIEQHCENTDLLATELQNKNDIIEKFVTKEKYCENLDQANGSDESSGESSKWQIDDESTEMKSRRPVENIEDQSCSENLQCQNIYSESDENSEYEEEHFQDLNLTYSEYIDLFSLNLTINEQSKKKLNKRLWVEGSSKWSPKRKRPRRRINHGSPRTPKEEEFPSVDGQSDSQKIYETLNEEEKQMEMTETMEQLITPVRGSVSERSVGSSVSSSSPGRLVISQSPYWVVDDNVMTPNQSLVAENKEDCSQNSKCTSIEGIENLDASSHGVTACLKCNKEVQNSNLNPEKRDYYKRGCHCVCESSSENQKPFVVDGNLSSETSNQTQQRCKKAKLINKVLFNGGTFEIAQSPTKQIAIVTEPGIPEIQVPSIDGASEESNASIIPPTPGKNLHLEELGISSNSCKSESILPSLRQLPKASNTTEKQSNTKKYCEYDEILPKASNTREKISNTKKDCEYDENTKSNVNTFTETEKVNQSSGDNNTFCTVNLSKQFPSPCNPQNESNIYQAQQTDESELSMTSDTLVNSSAENISTKDVSEDGILNNLKIVKPKKNLKLVKKMNIEEFLRNIHK